MYYHLALGPVHTPAKAPKDVGFENYRSHKEVQAYRIKAIYEHGIQILQVCPGVLN